MKFGSSGRRFLKIHFQHSTPSHSTPRPHRSPMTARDDGTAVGHVAAGALARCGAGVSDVRIDDAALQFLLLQSLLARAEEEEEEEPEDDLVLRQRRLLRRQSLRV